MRLSTLAASTALLSSTSLALPTFSSPSSWRWQLPNAPKLYLPSFLTGSTATNDGQQIPALTTEDWAEIQALPHHHAAYVGDDEAARHSWIATALLPLQNAGVAGNIISGARAELENVFGTESRAELESVFESLKMVTEAAMSSKTAMDDPSEKTIWQLLNEDTDRYSKIIKLIELEGKDGEAKKILDDRHASITFFAPDNAGIPERHHEGGGGGEDDIEAAFQQLMADPTPGMLLDVHERYGHLLLTEESDDNDEQPAHRYRSSSVFRLFDDNKEDDDRKERERRRRIFKFILAQVLKYHGLPRALAATDLAQNNTVATALIPKFGANDGEPLRLRLEKKLVPPSLEINFYSKVIATASDKQARNGYLHTVDKPLLPPPSILDVAYLFPEKFAVLTSAIQKVHGTRAVEYEYDRERSKQGKEPVFRGAPAVTLFAPTNEAFAKLPERLVRFLFSPFGERALAKVLAYHVLPHHVVFTESVHEVKPHKKKHSHHHRHHAESSSSLGDPSFHVEADLPTLLDGEKLHITVDKSRVVPIPGAIKTSVKVNDIEVERFDVPALNGVAHVLPEVLKPPHKHEDKMTGQMVESEWENWEDWLEAWVEEE